MLPVGPQVVRAPGVQLGRVIVDAQPAGLGAPDGQALAGQGGPGHRVATIGREAKLVEPTHPGAHVGGGGLQLLAGIRALRPDVRICLMSGGLPTYTDEDVKRLGVAECFSKPMHLAELVAALERQLQE